ncbi:hypothetical protein F5972_17950 [Microbispora cellulosiformans]|uniref:Oligosaccharide flippase family protein n=1 Tax=Microbispora cellulosiformans TaxID=2614688 RepID=A0A5J5K319_9ACTN|nr:hypothetical protein [Microbispora cellulosiformans]KAA9377520.1 hypothetical protein F5972_17950 [Microbispora cellulosiformans]
MTRGRVRPPGRRHLRAFTSLSAAGFGEALLPTLGLVALVRIAGTEATGQVVFAQSLANLWFLLGDPCLENAAQRFVPLEQARGGRGTALFLRLLRLDAGIGLAATALALAVVLGTWLAGLTSEGFALTLALSVAGRGATAPYGTAFAGFALADRLALSGVVRVLGALLSVALSFAGLLAGGPLLYLAGQAAAALLAAAGFCLLAGRAVARALGAPSGSPPLPAGLLRFTVPATAGTTIAGMSDSGILAVAGLVGGPPLVTLLKIAMAPGRFYANLAIPVAAMLYPRLARAVAEGAGAAVMRRDVARVTRLMTIGGVTTAAVAVPVLVPVITLVYGPGQAGAGAVAVPLLCAACVKGAACWSNVLPLALGRSGWRLTYLGAEAALLVATLLAAAWAAPDAPATARLFAWGTLALAVLGTAFWLLSARRLLRRVPTSVPSGVPGSVPSVPSHAPGRPGPADVRGPAPRP